MGGSKKQTIGYWFRWAMHHGWAVAADALLEIRAGGVTAWTGRLTSNARLSIRQPNLWGGEQEQGGMDGDLDVLFGGPEQTPNDYLLGEFGQPQSANIGVVSTVWRGGRFGAFVPNPKPLSMKFERIFADWAEGVVWYPEKAAIPRDGVVPVFTTYWRRTIGNPHIFTSPPEVLGWSANPADYDVQDSGEAVSWPTGVGATGIAWLHIDAPFGVPAEFDIDVKVNYDDSGQVIGTNGVWIGPATAPPVVSGYPRSEGVRVIVPAHSGAFSGWVAFACVDARDIKTGEPLGSPSAHRMLCSSIGVIASADTMNPAHIIYDAATHPDMKGDPIGLINDASFRAAADYYYASGFGLCTIYDADRHTPEQFIQRICDVAGCCFTQSRVDGMYYLDVITDDIDMGSLPVVTEDDILIEEFEHTPSVPGEAVNAVRVEWHDPQNNEDRTTQPNVALGRVRAQGEMIVETRVYHEIPNEQLALRVAQRDRSALSTPIERFDVPLKARRRDLREGLPFRLQVPSRGFADTVVRVGKIESGTHLDATQRISAVQIAAALPDAVYVQPQPAIPEPSVVAEPSPNQLIIEAPYIALAASLPASELAAVPDDAGYIIVAAQRVAGAMNYVLHSRALGADYTEAGLGDWCPTATIAGDPPRTQTEFVLENGSLLGNVAIGSWALWDDEIVRVDAIDVVTGAVTLGRGCADTVPQLHPDTDSRIWFLGDWAVSDNREYVDADTIYAKLLTRSRSEVLSINAASELVAEMAQRPARPYPPAALHINDEYDPTYLHGDLVLTWMHRDRLLQADQIIDDTIASIGPEPGTTYTVRCYVDDVPDSTQNGIVGATATFTPSADGIVRIEVDSARGGLPSWQAQSRVFAYTADEAKPLELQSGGVVQQQTGAPIYMMR